MGDERLETVRLVVPCAVPYGRRWRALRVRQKGEGVCCRLSRAAGGSVRWSTAHDGNSAKLEHAGRKQVNAGLMGISIAALKQSCKQWKAVRAIL